MDTGQQNYKRLIKSKSGLKIVAELRSPFLLREPDWIADNQTLCCMECKKKFDFLTRRHHCRRCGRIYCKTCCDFRLELPRMCFVDPVRQCQMCADISRQENPFFTHDIKCLMNGANFQLINTSDEDCIQPIDLLCRLSSDHRMLTLDSGSTDLYASIEFERITELSVLRTPQQKPEDIGWDGLFLCYKDVDGSNKKMTLIAAADTNKKQAISWLSAINNGFRLVCECRI